MKLLTAIKLTKYIHAKGTSAITARDTSGQPSSVNTVNNVKADWCKVPNNSGAAWPYKFCPISAKTNTINSMTVRTDPMPGMARMNDSITIRIDGTRFTRRKVRKTRKARNAVIEAAIPTILKPITRLSNVFHPLRKNLPLNA